MELTKNMEITRSDLQLGDNVIIGIKDLEVVRAMQEKHGGWNLYMYKLIDTPSKYVTTDDGGIIVQSGSGEKYRVNPDLLQKYIIVQGDKVKLISDQKTMTNLQEGHGGWCELMSLFLGEEVEIVKVCDNDYFVTKFGMTWLVNGSCIGSICKESTPKIKEGDKVKLISDQEAMTSLQENHGGWCDLMSLFLGEEVEIIKIFNDDYFVTKFGMTWLINDKCLERSYKDGANEIADLKQIIENLSKEWSLEFIQNYVDQLLFTESNDEQDTMSFNKIIKNLVLSKLGPTKTPRTGDTALHNAVLKNNLEACKSCVRQEENINTQNNAGFTPIMLAAKFGYLDILKFLLTLQKANLNLGDSEKNTALHLAISSFQVDSVQLLLDSNADTKAPNKKQFNACHLAAYIGHKEILELILKKTGNSIVDIQKDDKFAAIHLCVLNKNPNCLSILLKYNADINLRNAYLQTPLHIAVIQKDMECIKVLVENNAELNLMDNNGDVPLIEAVWMHSLNHLMKENAANSDINHFLEIIKGVGKCSCNPKDIIIYLVKNGAKIDIKNKKGYDAVSICYDENLKVEMQTLQCCVSIKHNTDTETNPPGPVINDYNNRLVSKTCEIKNILNKLKEQKICFICRDRNSNASFQCGHLACEVCAHNIFQCYICRFDVKVHIKPSK